MKKRKKNNQGRRQIQKPWQVLQLEKRDAQFKMVADALISAAGTQDIRNALLALADAINNAATAVRDLREKSTAIERLAELLHIAKVA